MWRNSGFDDADDAVSLGDPQADAIGCHVVRHRDHRGGPKVSFAGFLWFIMKHKEALACLTRIGNGAGGVDAWKKTGQVHACTDLFEPEQSTVMFHQPLVQRNTVWPRAELSVRVAEIQQAVKWHVGAFEKLGHRF